MRKININIPQIDGQESPAFFMNSYLKLYGKKYEKKIYEENLHKKYELIGALSWQFSKKTKISGEKFLQHIKNNPGYDKHPSEYGAIAEDFSIISGLNKDHISVPILMTQTRSFNPT